MWNIGLVSNSSSVTYWKVWWETARSLAIPETLTTAVQHTAAALSRCSYQYQPRRSSSAMSAADSYWSYKHMDRSAFNSMHEQKCKATSDRINVTVWLRKIHVKIAALLPSIFYTVPGKSTHQLSLNSVQYAAVMFHITDVQWLYCKNFIQRRVVYIVSTARPLFPDTLKFKARPNTDKTARIHTSGHAADEISKYACTEFNHCSSII